MTDNLMGEMRRPGRIEVVCGSMFSGKTEELIRRMKRAVFAHQKVEIFKPAIDTRYSDEDVVSHDSNSIRSTPVESSASILLLSSDIDVVGIDEAQFLDDGLVDVCNQLANRGVRGSSLAWTWTSRVCPSVPFLLSAPLPTTSRRCMPSA